MGSDMYMEAQNFRPRSIKAYWDGAGPDAVLVVEKDYPISGYTEIFRKNVNESDETVLALLRALGITEVPPRPVKPVSTGQRVTDVLRRQFDWHNGVAVFEIMEIIEEVDRDGIVR